MASEPGIDQAPLSSTLTFGEFRLVRDGQILLHHGKPIHIDPKAWDLLCCLLERPGKVLTKNELCSLVWKQVGVSDAALSQTIRRLRAVLQDDTRMPRYVETVHRRGIRFIATVREEHEAPHSGSADSTIFVGRQREMERLQRAVAAAQRGARQIILISGYAGIGKTTLLDQLVLSLPRSWRVARAACVEQHETPEPYLPVFTAVEQLARSDDGAETVATLRRFARTWLAQMPWLVDADEARDLREQVSASSRPRMLREIAAAFAALAAERGLFLAIEDLHWSDLATLDLLAVLAQRSDPGRLIIAVSFRLAHAVAIGHPVVDLARSLEAREHVTALMLDPLPFEGVETYLESRFPNHRFPAALAPGLFERTDGNPLFLRTIVDHMIETGWLHSSGDQWRLKEAFDHNDAAIVPASLRQMIEAVLSRIDPADVRLLEAASVIGPAFCAAAVAASQTASGIGLEQVEGTCERLSHQWHVLKRVGEQRWPDGTVSARYEFVHGLYATILYDHLAPSVRRRLHQSVGERLESAYAASSTKVSADLAMHFTRSGDDARALHHLVEAALAARARFADHESETYLSEALRRLSQLAPGATRDLQEAFILTARSLIRLVKQGNKLDADEQRSMQRATELLLSLPAQSHLFPLLRSLWQVQAFRCRPDEMRRLAQRLHEIAAVDERADQRAEAGLASGMTKLIGGSFYDAAVALLDAGKQFEQARQAREREQRPLTARWREIGVQIATASAWALTFQGRWSEADEIRQRGLALAEAGPLHPFSIAGMHLAAAAMDGLRGDLERARDHSLQALVTAEEHQLNGVRDGLLLQQAWLAQSGVGELGVPLPLGEQLAVVHDLPPSMFHPVMRLYAIESCLLENECDLGLDLLTAVRADTAARGVHWLDAEVVSLEAQLRVRRDPGVTVSAAADVRAAIDLALQQGAPLLALRAALVLRRLMPRDPEARRLLAELRALLPLAGNLSE